MNNYIEEIFAEYQKGREFKTSLGTKGMYEQSAVNARFYSGDQWSGAACGNDRPLVRHNIIKRIGDYKMSQILSDKIEVNYIAEGVANAQKNSGGIDALKSEIAQDPNFCFEGEVTEREINTVISALSNYRKNCAERLSFDSICASALKEAYICGGSVVYTYWDGDADGDISCEVLPINDVYFGDIYEKSVQNQPFIIISALSDVGAVVREAAKFGADRMTQERIFKSAVLNKVLVLTKLYKEYDRYGNHRIKCIKVTKSGIVRKPFDTGLTKYPLALFNFNERQDMIYGESEVTYLIPNQIAINRLITANVWSDMSMGMPLMVINGDTVTCDVSNDPGQIIKVYGSNEDVKNAVNYVSPPDCSKNFNQSIESLINNTLAQSGATPVALGEATNNTATALITLRDTAILSLSIVKNRFYDFIAQISKIWADFFIAAYGQRKIRIEDQNGIWYFPFDANRYKNLILGAKVSIVPKNKYNEKERFDALLTLFEKGIINKEELLMRLPEGLVPESRSLILKIKEERTKENDDGN